MLCGVFNNASVKIGAGDFPFSNRSRLDFSIHAGYNDFKAFQEPLSEMYTDHMRVSLEFQAMGTW